jgi:hypothetical protein
LPVFQALLPMFETVLPDTVPSSVDVAVTVVFQVEFVVVIELWLSVAIMLWLSVVVVLWLSVVVVSVA